MLQVWSLLTDSAAKVPHLTPKQMLLWTILAFYTININASYRSVLTAYLARPIFVETIQTLSDMVQSNLAVLFVTGLDAGIDDIGLFTKAESARLRPRLSFCHALFQQCLIKFDEIPHFCWTTNTAFKQMLEDVLPNRRYHKLERPLATVHNTIYTKKNFFLARKMSMILHRAAQAGLLGFWQTTFLKVYEMCDLNTPDWLLLKKSDAKRPVLQDYSPERVHPFNMTNLFSPFRLLGCGLAFATVVFVIEMFSSAHVYQTRWTWPGGCFTFVPRINSG